MAHAIDMRANSPANDLRDALDKAEMQVVQLNADTVEEFLTSLDTIKVALKGLTMTELDLRPEEVRWESLQSRILSNPGAVVSAANQAGGLTKLRMQYPPAEDYWWHLDKEVTQRRVQTLRRAAVTIGSILVILLSLYWAVNTFFPPNPDTLLMLDATNEVEALILNQEWEEALEIVQASKVQLPEEAELWIWEAVLYEQLGEDEKAAESLQQGESFIQVSSALFWVVVGNKRLLVGNFEGAGIAAQKAEAADPEEPQAYFLQGSVAEMNGDLATAIDMFEKTFNLAEDDDPQLAVIAKVRMGQLLQQGPALFEPGSEEVSPREIAPGEAVPEEPTQSENE